MNRCPPPYLQTLETLCTRINNDCHTTSQSRSLAVSRSRGLAASQSRNLAVSQSRSLAATQSRSLADSQSRRLEITQPRRPRNPLVSQPRSFATPGPTRSGEPIEYYCGSCVFLCGLRQLSGWCVHAPPFFCKVVQPHVAVAPLMGNMGNPVHIRGTAKSRRRQGTLTVRTIAGHPPTALNAYSLSEQANA